MDKSKIKTLHTASRAITADARRVSKATRVIQALVGFTSSANGEMEAAARAELAAALHSLQAHAARIAEATGEPAIPSTST